MPGSVRGLSALLVLGVSAVATLCASSTRPARLRRPPPVPCTWLSEPAHPVPPAFLRAARALRYAERRSGALQGHRLPPAAFSLHICVARKELAVLGIVEQVEQDRKSVV